MRKRSSSDRESASRTLIVTVGSILAVAVAAGVYFFARQVPAPTPEAELAPVVSNSESAPENAASQGVRAAIKDTAVASAAHAPRFSTQDAVAGVAPPSATDAEEAKDEDYAAQVGDTRPADPIAAAATASPASGDSTSDSGNSTD